MKIDKSRFTPEELEQYEKLIAKAKTCEDDSEQPEKEPEKPEPPDKDEDEPVDGDEAEAGLDKRKNCRKSTDDVPELAAALDRLSGLEKAIEMRECREVAKQYALLGEEESKLAETLYRMRKSNDAVYKDYIAVLDKSLALVQKSGVFEEIGKSGNGAQGGSVKDKIQAAATELQKSNAGMSRTEAVAKAWENHPELVHEYDAEYGVR